MKTLTNKYLKIYHDKIGNQIENLVANFDFAEDVEKFGYLTKASAVYSSNIEGNTVDVNSFMNYELTKKKANKEIEEIENLIEAYKFAQENKLDEKNFLKAHKIFAKTLVSAANCGKYRMEKVGVFSAAGLVYLAIEPEFVNAEMKVFFEDIQELLKEDLTTEQDFYYAAFLHLRFVHIHPFSYGNGRAARLLEKWFLAKKLGSKFWMLASEKYYKENQKEYYKNINLGVNFYELNYDKSIEFLEMLGKSIK